MVYIRSNRRRRIHSNPFVYHTMLYYYSTITLLWRFGIYVIHVSYHSPFTMTPDETFGIFLSRTDRDSNFHWRFQGVWFGWGSELYKNMFLHSFYYLELFIQDHGETKQHKTSQYINKSKMSEILSYPWFLQPDMMGLYVRKHCGMNWDC